jgi:hypothetical protein
MHSENLTLPPNHDDAPKRQFSFPHELADDPSLSLSEKRAILSEWASDACAIESFPTLRWLPGTTFPVTFSAVMDAREWLDRRMRDSGSGSRRRAPRTVVVADFAHRRETRKEG